MKSTVTGLMLVNTETGRDIRALGGSDTLNLLEYDHGLTIRARVNEDTMVTISEVNGREVDKSARKSMSLKGIDGSGNYLPYNFQTGDQTVTFIPSEKIRGRWTRGEPYTIRLSVIKKEIVKQEPVTGGGSENTVLNLILVNTRTGSDLKTLKNNDTVNLSNYNHGLSVRAITTEDTMVTISEVNGSEVNRGARNSKTLNGVDGSGNFRPYDFPLGNMELTFTPSTKINGRWTRGNSYTLSLRIQNQESSDSDTPADPPQSSKPPGNTAPDPVSNADVVFSGNYGETQYRPRNISGAKAFDALDAQWTIDNCGWTRGGQNNYPILLEESLSGSRWIGGYFNSVIPQDRDWLDVYTCNNNGGNSAAILARGDIDITGIRIDGAWDGVRFGREGTLKDSYISNTRDDGIEADSGYSMDVTDVLFDNVFVGISSTPSSRRSARIRLNNVLIRAGNYIYRGNLQSGAFLKVTDNTPGIEIHDSVFAFSKTSSIMNKRSGTAWSKIVRCSNNHLLWLEDSAIPSSFPLPPTCFKVVRGAEARRIWNQKRQDFLRSYPYRK